MIGGSWMVENVWEELDSGGEYFFNESTSMLYIIPNTTYMQRHLSSCFLLLNSCWVLRRARSFPYAAAEPPSDLIVPVLQQLIATTGTQSSPVEGLSITNVNFRDASAVYEEQWEVPSGGDWALHRSGAVFLQGTKDARISGGVFKRLDGNAIML